MNALVLAGSLDDLSLVDTALEVGSGCEVLSVLSPDDAQPVLERCRGRGASRCIHVWDPVLGDLDFLAMARVIGAAIRTMKPTPTWILSGMGRRGAIGAAVADSLDVPYLGSVVEVSREGDALTLLRHTGCVMYQYRRAGACVVGVVGATPPPAEPAAREVTGEIVRWSLGDIGLSEPEITYRRRFAPRRVVPPAREPRHLSADQLKARLVADGYCDRPSKPEI